MFEFFGSPTITKKSVKFYKEVTDIPNGIYIARTAALPTVTSVARRRVAHARASTARRSLERKIP
jgi:hypothetical protein